LAFESNGFNKAQTAEQKRCALVRWRAFYLWLLRIPGRGAIRDRVGLYYAAFLMWRMDAELARAFWAEACTLRTLADEAVHIESGPGRLYKLMGGNIGERDGAGEVEARDSHGSKRIEVAKADWWASYALQAWKRWVLNDRGKLQLPRSGKIPELLKPTVMFRSEKLHNMPCDTCEKGT
jgi:hypothetical protein